VPAGFPLVAHYVLDWHNGEGLVPIEPLYTRRPEQGWLPAEVEWMPYYDRQTAVRAWLRRMGGKATRTSVVGHSLRLRWTDETALRREIDGQRPVMEREFAAMIGELLAMGVLTVDEAQGAGAAVWIDLDDQRGGPQGPLPDLNEPVSHGSGT
jgi:hypothetical protein